MKKKPAKTSLLDESVVLSTIAALRLDEYSSLASEQSELVLDAIRRSTTNLSSTCSVSDIANYVQGFDDHQLSGLINNVKGITFEMYWTHAENSDGDSVHAHMFHDTNHPASDVIVSDGHGGTEQLQLKATDSAHYVQHAMHAHPDIPVVATSEVAHHVPGAIDGGISNAQLTDQVQDTIHHLHDSASSTVVAGVAAGGIAASMRALPILNSLRKGDIDRDTAKKMLVSSCTKSGVRAASLAIALHSPLAPLAGAYIAFRVIKRGVEVVRDNVSDQDLPPVPSKCES